MLAQCAASISNFRLHESNSCKQIIIVTLGELLILHEVVEGCNFCILNLTPNIGFLKLIDNHIASMQFNF